VRAAALLYERIESFLSDEEQDVAGRPRSCAPELRLLCDATTKGGDM
jgi:hypothetical protein